MNGLLMEVETAGTITFIAGLAPPDRLIRFPRMKKI
jgi:hypothetical protein